MSSYSIICADDDELARDLYEKLLAKKGYDVRTCKDGNEVIPEFERKSADLIIIDIDMPKKNGLQLCKELRRHATAHLAPILVCSSYETEEIMTRALSSGADDYIIKPTKLAELYAKVANLIQKNVQSRSGDQPLNPGCIFATQYRILKKLGAGGFSQVFQAEDVTFSPPRLTALKLFSLHQQKEGGPDYMAMFLREAYALSKLDHPNIIRFYHFGQCHHQYYLAMEFAQGQSLRQILDERGPIREAKVAMLGYHVLQALKYLHGHQIVHRDITPHNIMIVESGDVKLIDFGLAKPVKDGTLTPEGMFAGSPLYAAPELVMGLPLDTRADIFSLGASMYALITNVNPYPGKTPLEIFQNRFQTKTMPVNRIITTIGNEMSRLIEAMMAPEKEARPTLGEIETTLLKLIR